MVPVSASALAGYSFTMMVNSSTWKGFFSFFGCPTVVLKVIIEFCSLSSSVLSGSALYSPSLLSVSLERRTWFDLTSFLGHLFGRCPFSPQWKQAPSALRQSISVFVGFFWAGSLLAGALPFPFPLAGVLLVSSLLNCLCTRVTL